MVKFGKYLLNHRVPEWSGKYVPYKELKKTLKCMKQHPTHVAPSNTNRPSLTHLLERLSQSWTSQQQEQDQEQQILIDDDDQSAVYWHNGDIDMNNLSTPDTPMIAQCSQPILEDLKLDDAAQVSPSLSSPVVDPSQLHVADGASHDPLHVMLSRIIPQDQQSPMEHQFFNQLTSCFKMIESFYHDMETSLKQRVDELQHIASTNASNGSNINVPRHIKRLYHALLLLVNYRILNYIGILKSIKKYDKLTGHHDLPLIQAILDQSYFFTSPVLYNCLNQLTGLYAHHVIRDATMDYGARLQLAKKALEPTNPIAWNDEERTFSKQFVFGLGYLLSTLSCQVILINVAITLTEEAIVALPIYRLIGILLLHCWLWLLAMRVMISTRVNYSFILELDPQTITSIPQLFQFLAIVSIIYLASLNLYLLTCVCQAINVLVQAMPYFMFASHIIPFTAIIVMIVNPSSHSYVCSTRCYLGRVLCNILRLPFGNVSFQDTFFANQGTSLMNCFSDFSYIMCFYYTSIRHITQLFPMTMINDSSSCTTFNNAFISWWFSSLPNYWRFVQCMKRYIAGAGVRNLGNGIKYGNRLIVMLLDTLYGNEIFVDSNHAIKPYLFIMWLGLFAFNICYSCYWDLVQDWGLFRSPLRSKYPLLRPTITLSQHRVYYIAMFANVVFRVISAATLSPTIFFGPSISSSWTATFFFLMESWRRSLWNFFRIEHEHFNNVCKFRAVDLVPLVIAPNLH